MKKNKHLGEKETDVSTGIAPKQKSAKARSINLNSLPKRSCPLCGGSGKVSDDRETGGALKSHREDSGVTLREVGRRMGFSAAYISDLEHGRRAWNAARIAGFLKACRKAL